MTKGASVALIELDEHSGIPLWVQLRNRLMYLIDSGHYQAGDRLPTVRALAADLNVNYHTVNKVYTSATAILAPSVAAGLSSRKRLAGRMRRARRGTRFSPMRCVSAWSSA